MPRGLASTRRMDPSALANHFFSTYTNLRYGMAVIAVAFPVLLYLGGLVYAIGLQNSMSHYYWAVAQGERPMRIYFVGVLFIVGAFLYLYKGFTPIENYALNIAGVSAIGVALFPMCRDRCRAITAHGTFAVILFLCVAYVSIACATDTLRFVQDKTLHERYRHTYRVLGIVMVVSPGTAFIMSSILTGGTDAYVFFIETVGIWAFAAYWWVKSRELKHTNAELLALKGAVEVTPEGARLVGRT